MLGTPLPSWGHQFEKQRLLPPSAHSSQPQGGRFEDVVIPPARSLKTHGCTRPSFRRRLAFIPHTQAPWASPHLQFWGSPGGRVVREPALLRTPPASTEKLHGTWLPGRRPSPPSPPGPVSSVHPVMSKIALPHHEPEPGANTPGKWFLGSLA